MIPTTATALKPVFCSANRGGRQWLFETVAIVGALAVATFSSTAADVTMTASDGYNQQSWSSALHWSDGLAPTGDKTYDTLNFTLRTVGGSAGDTFAGASLTLSPPSGGTAANGSLLLKGNNGCVWTVNNLIMAGGAIGAGDNTGPDGIHWIAGNINVVSDSYFTDTSGGPRYIGVSANLTGTAGLSNCCYVIYSGNNSGFSGPLSAGRSSVGGGFGTIIVTNEAVMGSDPATFNAAQLYLNGGTFRPAGSFSLDHAHAGITIGPVGGVFDIAAGLTLTNAEPLAGSGTLSVTNAGTLVHSGSAANFTGNLSISGGTFIVPNGGSLAGANTITVGSGATFDVTATGLVLADGQALSGNGTVQGTVTAGTGSKITPGGTGTATLTLNNNLVLSGGAALLVDFGSTNDGVAVNGDVTPSGVTTIQVGSIPVNGTYTLITVGGTLGGAASNFQVQVPATRKVFALAYASNPNRLVLTVSGGAGANLVWQGDGVNNYWDVNTSLNWLNGATPDTYLEGDIANFTDVGALNPPVLNTTVSPGAVNFLADSDYLLSGSGVISGPAALTKGGTGTLTLSLTNNTYTGGTLVTNGVLRLGPSPTNDLSPLGKPVGTTPLLAVSGTGTLDLDGGAFDAFFTNAIQISGHGFSATQGAIDNTSGGLTSGGGDVGIGTLELTGDSTVSAASNWQIGTTGRGIVGNGYTLTKIGGESLYNYLYLRRAAASPLGNFVIAGGAVLFWDAADAVGAATPIILTNNGAMDTWNPSNNVYGMTFANPIIVNDPVNGGRILNFRSPGWTHPAYDVYNGAVLLNGTLTITNGSHSAAGSSPPTPESWGRVTLNGNITGSGGLNVIGDVTYPVIVGTAAYGGNLVTLNGNNSYTGPTVVSNLIQLRITTANQGGGSYTLVNYGMLDVVVAAGKPTIPMASLSVGSADTAAPFISFSRLSTMPTDPVIYATNLTITSGSILPPVAGYSVGQFPLIKYGTIGGSGFAGLVLANLPSGVSATLVDNTANHSIDLAVTQTGVVWKGSVSSDWDTATANWLNPVSSSTFYADGDSVMFNDTASSFAVNVPFPVAPQGVTVDAANDYSFSGDSIGNNAALIKKGSGTLTISSTNNTFTGGTYIHGGTIKLADQNYAYPYGGGALNNNRGVVMVADGGTLDINGVQVPNYAGYGPDGYNVFIAGAGVDGNGALVNNVTNNPDLADPGYLTLTGDATVGGIGDINIRHGATPQLVSQSSAYTLTKVGSGQFRIRYTTAVSTNFGVVNILEGRVTYESSSPLGFGDGTKPIYVGSGAGFTWGTAASACARPLYCSNNATLYGLNTANNVFTGPVTLVGGTIGLNANYYNGLVFSNAISGAGGISLQYNSYATFAAANTYSGNTTVNNCNAGSGSVLRLVGNGSINNSPSITLLGVTASQALPGALDASGRTDGTFTLLSGQTLRGDNGSYVRGNAVASSGATITPGGPTNIQYLSFSNNLTLQAGSAVAMDVSMDGSATNDTINVSGTATYNGTLQLTNIGTTPLVEGNTFKLFNAGGYSGNFASIAGSPASGLNWSFNPATGIATVVGSTASNPTNITYSISGNQLTLSWPADHLGWILQAQTNSTSIGLSSNWVDLPETATVTQKVITVSPANGAVFYRLRNGL